MPSRMTSEERTWRYRSNDLLTAVFPDAAACQENIEGEMRIPDHPLIREVMKDALTEAMDLEGLNDLLPRILDGRIRCLAVDTPVPSQFSHEILNANPFAYLDDAPLEERRARAVEMRRVLPETVASDIGRLDPAAIEEVREDAWPDVRDAEELHDALETLIAFPEPLAPEQFHSESNATSASPKHDALELAVAESIPQWWGFFSALASQGRAGRARISGRNYWVAAERTNLVASIFPAIRFDSCIAEIEQPDPSNEDASSALLNGCLQHSGPVHARALSRLFSLPESEISNSLLRIEATGTILRGHSYRGRGPAESGGDHSAGRSDPRQFRPLLRSA